MGLPAHFPTTRGLGVSFRALRQCRLRVCSGTAHPSVALSVWSRGAKRVEVDVSSITGPPDAPGGVLANGMPAMAVGIDDLDFAAPVPAVLSNVGKPPTVWRPVQAFQSHLSHVRPHDNPLVRSASSPHHEVVALPRCIGVHDERQTAAVGGERGVGGVAENADVTGAVGSSDVQGLFACGWLVRATRSASNGSTMRRLA
jgi:hypothetical protein